jgi:hypothetical protein
MKYRGRGLVQITGRENLQDGLENQFAKILKDEIDREVLNNALWEATLKECKDWHPVELKWEKGKDTTYFWNQACAWAVENFGLPGEKYVTHPSTDHMLFLFKNEKDAILMTLKWL